MREKHQNFTRAGVIDIGSSSIKLTIGEKIGEDLNVLEFMKSAIPIGAHTFFRQRISQETINQAVRILNKYKQALEEYEVPKVFAIATTAVREAKNSDVFVDTILRKTGLNIEILTVGEAAPHIVRGLLKPRLDLGVKDGTELLVAEVGK